MNPPFQQGLFDGGELGVRQPWRRSARDGQGVDAATLPTGMPNAHGLGGDAELAGNLGLAHAGGEQFGRAEPAALEPVTLLLCRSAARNSWHPRILTRLTGAAPTDLASLTPTSKAL